MKSENNKNIVDSKFWLLALTCMIGYIFFIHYNVLFLTSPFEGDIGRDLYYYYLVSMGQLPYIDFNWIYGPLMPLIYGLGNKILGVSLNSTLQIWYLILLTSTYFLYFIVKTISNRFFGFIAGSYLICYYGFILHTFNHIGALPVILASIFLTFLYFKEEKVKYMYLLAICYILLAFIKINMALVFSVPTYLTIYLFHYFNKKPFKDAILSNILIVIVPLIVYGVLFSFAPIDQINKWFPFLGSQRMTTIYTPIETIFSSEIFYISPIAKGHYSFYFLHRTANLIAYYFIIPAIIFIFSIFAIFKGNKQNIKDYTFLLLLSFITILSTHELLLAAASYSVRFWTLPALLILLFRFLQVLINEYGTKKIFKPALTTFISLLFMLLGIKLVFHTLYMLDKKYYCPLERVQISFNDLHWYAQRLKAMEYIDTNLQKDEQLLSIPYDLLNNYISKRDYPSRITEFMHLSQITEEDELKVINDIEKQKIKYIVYSTKNGPLYGGLGIFGKTHCKILYNYILKNYQADFTIAYKNKNPNNLFDIIFYKRTTPFKKQHLIPNEVIKD